MSTPNNNGVAASAGQNQSPGNSPNVVSVHSHTYLLHRYFWRTILNVTGPLLLLGFYTFICFYYLEKPPLNEIVASNKVDARWPYYAWFIISIFALEWARSGLANIEATALMRPTLAPTTAMKLMWHADANWANVLWWLRALRNLLLGKGFGRFLGKRRRVHESRPGRLWWFLSVTTFFLFIAIPLSGLTMELTVISAYSAERVKIRGSHPDNFNLKGSINLNQIIRGKWRIGGRTTPSDASIIYAARGVGKVSSTYYDDEVVHANNSTPLQVFVGPAVDQAVHGNAWGLESTISCRHVSQGGLQLLQVHGWNNYSILASYQDGIATFTPSAEAGSDGSPHFVDETGDFYGMTAYSLVVAAEGANYGDTPYASASNHDFQSIDGQTNSTPADMPTTALFEAYLWQGFVSADPTMLELLKNSPDNERIYGQVVDPQDRNVKFDVAGFGVQCRVKSAVGNANIDPAYRTYSSFQRGTVAKDRGGDQDLYPVQIQALDALGNYDELSYKMTPYDPNHAESTWLAMHLSIGSTPYISPDNSDYVNFHYPAHTPDNMILAFRKLFGECMIAMMGPSAQEPWKGDLKALTTTHYLKQGVVPWEVVFALLLVWTLILFSTSIWMAFTRRWTPALGGFEFFKFGAEYSTEIHGFEGRRFEKCDGLKTIPGMVGTLPGDIQGGQEGYIGLSTSIAPRNGRYVLERKAAGKHPVAP